MDVINRMAVYIKIKNSDCQISRLEDLLQGELHDYCTLHGEWCPPDYCDPNRDAFVYLFTLGGSPPRDMTVGRPLAHMCLGPRGGVSCAVDILSQVRVA